MRCRAGGAASARVAVGTHRPVAAVGVALDDIESVVRLDRRGEALGVADEGDDLVAAFERLFDEGATGSTARTEYGDSHAAERGARNISE